MRIVQVEHIPFEPRFSGSGYAMSMTRQIILYDKLLRITLEDGSQGVGENVRWLSYPVAAAEAAEEEMLPQLEGVVLADLPRLMRDWCRRGKEWRGFCFALHSAYLDIVSQKLGVPVASLLGGPAHGFVPEYLSLSSETPEEMATMIRSRGADYHIIQAKLGTGEVEEDIARVRAVLDAMTPQQMLLADFNGALTVDTALRWLGKIEDPRLMWEEPCDTYDENIEVAKKISMPFMFDQSMTDIETYIRAIQDKYAEAVVIKPSLLGPLSEAVVVRDACAAAGIQMRIDGPWCGQIGAWMALNLAVGAPQALMLAAIDLTDPIETPNALIHRDQLGRIGPAPAPDLNALFEAAFT